MKKPVKKRATCATTAAHYTCMASSAADAPIPFVPSLDSALALKVLSSRGSAFSIKTSATHDRGRRGQRHFIDASFLARLPDGRSMRERLGPTCLKVSTLGEELPVLGILSDPLPLSIKSVSDDVECPDAQRYQLRVELRGVYVVQGLPVPLHVSVKALSKTLDTRDGVESLWSACGLDTKCLAKEHFSSVYQRHAFWLCANLAKLAGEEEEEACGDGDDDGTSGQGAAPSSPQDAPTSFAQWCLMAGITAALGVAVAMLLRSRQAQ